MSRREFLVHIVLDAGHESTERLKELRAAEAARAHQLTETGNVKRLWRLSEGWSNIGLWSATDEAELWALLDSLPLRPHMTISVRDLHAHPSDPGDGSDCSASQGTG